MSGKGTWIKYVIASGLIHAAILSAYVPMNASHRPDPIEVFVLDAPSPPSPLSLLGQVAKRTKMTGGPRAAGPKVKEQVSARSREQVAGPSELKTKSLPAAPASPPRNEVVANTGLLAPPGPEDGVTAGGSGTSGSGTSGSGSNGFAGGTGTGSGSGQDGGTGSSGTGFGAPGGPRFLHREVPEYPMLARRRGKEGTVILMVTIDAAGNLSKVDVVKASDKLFVEPSVNAVKRSTFLPARRNGEPVACAALLPMRFTLREDRKEP